jgi:site-specific DNA recombinase
MMLNILMTFSQYEREIITERVRDRVAMAKRRGKYCGGTPVIGYDPDPEKKILTVNEAEAKVVRHIFDRYPELGSAKKLAAELNKKGWLTKQWTSAKGKIYGGKEWTTANIYKVLDNPLYLGKVVHRDKTYSGEHDAIITQKQWDKIRALFESGSHSRNKRKKQSEMKTPLRGLVRCGHCGGSMSPTYSMNGKKRYAYYFCQKDSKRAVSVCPVKRVPGGDIEKAILQQLSAVFRTPTLMAQTILKARESKQAERSALLERQTKIEKELKKVRDEIIGFPEGEFPEKTTRIEKAANLTREFGEVKYELERHAKDTITEEDVLNVFSHIESLWEMLFPAEQYRLMRLMIECVIIREDVINIILKTDEMPSLISELAGMELSPRNEQEQSANNDRELSIQPDVLPEGKVMLRVPTTFKYKNGRKTIITPQTLEGENPESPDLVQEPMVQAISNAHQWREKLESGEFPSVAELARSLNFSRSYVVRILSLTSLAPNIVNAIMNGEEPNGLSLQDLVSGFPDDWEEQRKLFGFKKKPHHEH